MGKFDGVLLVSDYDDTLLGSDLRVPERNLDALRYFLARGGRFTVATGRSQRAFVRAAAELPINAPVALSNGAAIYDFQADRLLWSSQLGPFAEEDCRALGEAFPTLAMEVCHGEEIFAYRPNMVTRKHMERVGTTCRERDLADIPRPWDKVVLEEEEPVLRQAQAYVKAHWPDRYEIIFSNRYLLEMTDKGSHKGNLVLMVARRIGIDPAHIYCVGDNQNDLPMLKVSAIPFVPSNAVQLLKDWGATVVGSCDQGCVADIVELLDKRY